MWLLWTALCLQTCSSLEIGSKTILKLTQFTDLHFGENAKSDDFALSLQRDLLAAETPDVVVLTGDMVSGYAWNGLSPWYEDFHALYTLPMRERGIPWALTLGNHDTEADLTGAEIMQVDRRQELSLAPELYPYLNHSSNYYVPITQQGKLVFLLWMLDSGSRDHCEDRQGYDCVHRDQVQWLKHAQKALFLGAGKPIPGFVFMHIPSQEFMEVWEGGQTEGFKYEDVSCWAKNTGFITDLKHIVGVAVGHDHFNDYSGYFHGIHLYYGRKTGHAGNGPSPYFLRGARSYLIDLETGIVRSHIRDESGEVIVHNRSMGLRRKQDLCAESSGWSLSAYKTISAVGIIFGGSVVLCGVLFLMKTRRISRVKSARFAV